MHTLLLIIDLVVAVAIVVLVLLQHGKGADMGAAFGSGASGSLFGASGSANFLSRATAVLAAIFFAVSLALGWYSARQHTEVLPQSVVPVQHSAPAVPAAPATPAAPAAQPSPTDVPMSALPAGSGTQKIPN